MFSTESLLDETHSSDQGGSKPKILKNSMFINSPVQTSRRKGIMKKYEVVF